MEVDDQLGTVEPRRVKQLLSYALGALVRRKLLAGILFILGLATAVGILKMLPRSYHVDTKILAQKQQALPMLTRYVSDEPPTYVAAELIRRRDNVRAIVEKTNLIDHWQFPPTPPLSKEEKLNALVGMLTGALSVTTGEGTVTIAIDWPDGEMAAQLVEAALQSYLDSRRLAELSSIGEAIGMLEARAGTLRSQIETMETERAATKSKGAKDARASRLGRFDATASQLRAMLDARKRVIRETEDFRQRRLEELQVQLAEKLAVYGESYPLVINLKKEIQSFSREPQQLVALRAEERELEAAYRGRASGFDSADGEDGLARRLYDAYDERDEGDLQRRFARIRYQTLLERIESTKIDLETARTAFKYRYSVVWPAQNPGAPNRPNMQTGMILGTIAALLLAALGATLADLRANRFVTAWQVESALDLPIIAEVRRS
jgi:uncharacterized protein involved in exopolysaccharide biosynthesis